MWSCLAGAQLEHGAVTEAIASYLRGQDDSRYLDVITRANEVRCTGSLASVCGVLAQRAEQLLTCEPQHSSRVCFEL